MSDLTCITDPRSLEVIEKYTKSKSTGPTSRGNKLNSISKIDILFLDCLLRCADHGTHIGLHTAITRYVRWLKPKKTYLVGMGHEFDTLRFKREFAGGVDVGEEHIVGVELAFDGMRIPV